MKSLNLVRVTLICIRHHSFESLFLYYRPAATISRALGHNKLIFIFQWIYEEEEQRKEVSYHHLAYCYSLGDFLSGSKYFECF